MIIVIIRRMQTQNNIDTLQFEYRFNDFFPQIAWGASKVRSEDVFVGVFFFSRYQVRTERLQFGRVDQSTDSHFSDGVNYRIQAATLRGFFCCYQMKKNARTVEINTTLNWLLIW